MKVPFADFRRQYHDLKNEIDTAISRVLENDSFILGDNVGLFEKEFAEFCGSKFGVGVNSGTDALFLGLLSLGVGKGDEVIVPANTYIASALAVTYTQAKPVLVDADIDSYNINLDKIKAAISKRTKAILPVHLYGQPVKMPDITKIADKYGLNVIEDCAQSHGARLNTRMTGTFGDIGCFSFYPTKNLGAFGDAGMIITDKPDIYSKLLKLRAYGRKNRYENVSLGYNSRLDTIQAAILRVKLTRLQQWNRKRQEYAQIYNERLDGVRGLVVPRVIDGAEHVYHIYAVRSKDRHKIMQGLKDAGVDTLIHYPIPIHLQKVYKGLGYKRGDFPAAEKISREVFSLPIYPEMGTSQVKYICKELVKIVEN
ncbi:MAG: DegT/DnrJ/EryC1/StrS family aminotransferase [Candidatus Omnitrophota bacterium]|jgi:dTDP-4-amino-4,6-dideoxygalactose transaminase|nr:MAG: DegT/DnrJ/EryC1/StrS family aminotransferase [Candidatus Omnitrophota bacterium]